MKNKILFLVVFVLLVMYVGLNKTQAVNVHDTICQGDSITIGNAFPGTVWYLWTPGSYGNTPQISVSPTTNTTYIETDLNAAYVIIHVDTFNVVVKPKPLIWITSAGSVTTVCTGGSLSLTAHSNLTPCHYLWSTGDTTTSIVVSPVTSPTTYTVTGTYNGCSNTASFTVYIQPSPVVFTITGDSTYCAGQLGVTIGLNGSESDCYYTLYKNNVGIMNINGTGFALSFGNQTTGTYTVKGFKNNLGCSAQMNGTLHVTTLPLPQAAGAINGPTTVCQNTIANYSIATITNATSYDWSMPTGATITLGQGTPTITVDFGQTSVSGTIKVRGHNACGDGQYSSILVTVNVAPLLIVSASDTVICAGETVTLTANTNADSVLWNDGSTQNPRAVSPLTTTVYMVTVIGANGCTTASSLVITVHALPIVGLGLIIDHSCTDQNKVAISGGLVNGSPSPGGHYSSSTGCVIVNDTLYPSLSFVGTYAVTYTFTNQYGCTNYATDLFTIYPVPAVNFYSINAIIATDTPPFDMTPFVTPSGGVFSGPGTLTGSSWYYPQLAGGGNHMVTYTYTHPISGCSASQIQYISVNALGINELSAATEHINIFPNPASNELNLSGVATKTIKEICIINVLGKVVFTTRAITETMHIDISAYATGTYLIQFIDADGLSKGKRFVKSE